MSDPVLALILLASFFLVITVASWFKTLERGLWREAHVTFLAGAIAAVAAPYLPLQLPVASAVLLTIGALYLRLTGRESEPSEGMALGAMMGAAAGIAFVVLSNNQPLLRVSECILAGAVAGYGITSGLAHIRRRGRQFAGDVVTAVLAAGASLLPGVAIGMGVRERDVAIACATLAPLLLTATVFKQWPVVRAELRHEAVLGVMDEEDVRVAAHPFLRLGRGAWHDSGAHREFVRIASKIALRKRQQRNRPDEVARLYQLEVIKLRMQMQEMTRIDRAMRAQAAGATAIRTMQDER
jgi:hypothetical protein